MCISQNWTMERGGYIRKVCGVYIIQVCVGGWEGGVSGGYRTDLSFRYITTKT